MLCKLNIFQHMNNKIPLGWKKIQKGLDLTFLNFTQIF